MMKSENNQFAKGELKKIDEADDLHIAPFRVDGNLYVRAYNGVNSRWYKAALLQKAGRIQAAGITKEVAFELVQGDINNAIDEAYKKKYSSSPYLSPMISNRARAATVKITPI